MEGGRNGRFGPVARRIADWEYKIEVDYAIIRRRNSKDWNALPAIRAK